MTQRLCRMTSLGAGLMLQRSKLSVWQKKVFLKLCGLSDSDGFWVWKCQCPKFSFSILCDLCSVPAKIEFYIHCQWSKSASMPLNTEWHTMTHRTTSAWSSLALVFWLRFGQVVPQDMSFLVLRIGCSTSSRDSRHKKWFGKARCLQMIKWGSFQTNLTCKSGNCGNAAGAAATHIAHCSWVCRRMSCNQAGGKAIVR